MSWFNVWDGLKNKTCRYLLQRYLGQFLDEKLNLEQLNIELYNGKATIKNVSLRVEALNELLDAQGWPFEFTDGQIGLLTVSVPWNALMTNDSSIEASDVVLCLRPVKRAHECHESMIESMWSSVSSSLQLAEECMRQEEEDDESACTATGSSGQTGGIVGLEKFAETIDNVLNRIQAKFTNITFKIEYPCHYRLKGVALNIHLQEVFYKNETGKEKMPQMSSTDSATIQSEELNRLPTYAKHSVNLTGVSLFTQENWVSEEEIGIQHENIPILQLMGQQNLQIKVKQSEEITGPKICFDIELGAICAIFSPRQLQLLTHFLEAFSEDESCRESKQQLSNAAVYCQEELESQHARFGGNLAQGNFNMWNTPVAPNITNVIKPAGNNFYGHRENYCDSLASSSLSSSTITSVSRYQRKPTNMDSCAEISNFVIKISALVAVILHEDILVESNSNSYQHFWNERSLKELLQISEKFFDYAANTPVERDLGTQSSYCKKNHVFLRLNPIVAEGKQNRNKTILQISTTISATKVELCEVLEGQITHLLKFDRNKNCFNGYQIRPEFTMNFSSSNSIQMKKNSRTNIEIMLEENILEFDITIIDRLGSFFAPSPYRNLAGGGQTPVKEDVANAKTEFCVNCSLLDIKLRFPIVDLRPLHDPNRVPWWKQNIRSDYLLLRFSDFKLIFVESKLKIYATQIEIFYAETDDLQNHLLTASYHKLPHARLEERPQIIVDFAERSYASLEAGCEPKLPFSSKRHCRQSSTSAYTNRMENDLTENILLPGEKQEIDEFCKSTMENSEIQVKLNFPLVDFFIESKQLYELIYNRLNTDLFMWEPSCPYLTKSSVMETQTQMAQSLLNMSLMDSVYISAIAQTDNFGQSYEQQSQSLSSTQPPPVVLEQSDQSDDNRGEDELDDEDDDGITSKQQPPKTFAAKISHHNCSVEIKLGKVSGSCFVPVRDNDKHVLPQVCGKFLVNVEQVNIFLVAGFKSDVNLSYLCTQIKSGEIYHCGIVPMNTPLRFDHQSQVEDFMQSTIYKIPQGLTKGIQINDNSDMFSIVIEMKKNPTQRIKRLKITAGIHYATLRYNPTSPSLYWINQLIDFLDVLDYPIEGYKPFSVLSEMQLHLWDCAIDFRPENFCYRAVLELFYFSICSNIIPSMPCCNLRFVLEECVLALAPYEESTHKKFPLCMVSFIDSQNLVPVLDVGLLDISLRLSDDDELDKCPTFDLRCSIHDVHFRTCYDSGSAFAQLIGYLASISNNSNEQYAKEQSLQSSLSSESDFFSSQTEQQLTKEISKKQQERVNILMAEAVQESPEENRTLETINEEEPARRKDELKLFYFPDENNKHLGKKETTTETATDATTSLNKSVSISSDDAGETLPIIKAEFGEVTEEDSALFEDLHNGSSNEEDYCIIAEEENAFVNPQFASGSIEVSADPLMIVDNHFCLPSSSSNDLLRTPSNFPMPEQRYTLCEMTVTWHLYGGHDFSSTSPTKTNNSKASSSSTAGATASGEPSSNKTAMSETYRQGVFYANESCRLQQIKKPKEKLTWKSVGGSNRNHEVLVEMQFTKVRFSYEIYPRQTSYASRQVLLVNEIEIRDRLQSSEINKFLYNANTKSFSNRRSQHMVVVKAIHVRPNPQLNNNQECSLRISLSPLRVHIDQDTLEFLADFFTNFGKSCDKDNASDNKSEEDKHTKLAVAKTEVPIMTISEDEQELPDAVQDLRARRIVNENISLLIDEQENSDSKSVKSDHSTITASSQEINTAPVYFREVIFTPDVSIRFDYHGRRVELSKGPIAGLLMGLGQLQCSEIILRKIVYKRGLLGFEKVCNYLCKEWLRDIKRNQLPKILSGVGPTYAFVQLFQGIYDLFWLPIEHYQKDGRLIRGLQLGAQSFSARTILAALEITSRLIQILQFTAETAFDMVSSGPSVRQSKKSKRGRKKRHHRPKDIREGVVNAYQILKEGINDSANNLIETAAAEHDQKGLTGAVGAVMRQVPQLVVCPAVLATQATTNILGGVKSSLVPEAKLEAKEKWKDDNC